MSGGTVQGIPCPVMLPVYLTAAQRAALLAMAPPGPTEYPRIAAALAAVLGPDLADLVDQAIEYRAPRMGPTPPT